ncbi:MAG: hypothetical protein IPN44_01660 [Flavobacteriales bacterium]|nr:hypothetical protein [Flavobacteriales bacterium]
MLRLSTIVLALITLSSQAQISHGGQPLDWGNADLHPMVLPGTTLGTVDRAVAVAAADTVGAARGFRFGTQRLFTADMTAQGQWHTLPDGGRVCRYEVKSAGAVMMSLQFSSFHLPWGGQLFVYDAARTRFLGAFTRANESPDGKFATAMLPGDAVVLEYREPAGAPAPEILLEGLTHAWRSMFPQSDEARDFNPGYQALPCHNNVACPIADEWQDQIHATIWFVMPSGLGCNGTLLNNTAQNGTPYVLIANHCYQPTESQWLYYFNYQSPTCIGDTGQTMQTVLGSYRRSILYHGDFCLMEMFDTPPPAFNAYYAGWDRSGTPPQSGAAVIDPAGDVKKISFYSTPATSYLSQDGEFTPCWSVYWSNGIQEAGASGAPLFDQNKRLVAHMVDGVQTCTNYATVPSYGSKFSENWDGGTAPGSRLRDWLDPSNTHITLNGWNPNANTPLLKVKLKAMLKGPFVPANGNMSTGINDMGLLPLTEPYTALGYQHVGGGGESTTQTVLNVTGGSRVVDWVVLELRDANVPGSVIATRSALILKNGKVVDVDGASDVAFTGTAAGSYYVALHHRNHLAIMTATTKPISTTATLIDLSSPSTLIYGGEGATTLVNGVRCLWSGDANGDQAVKYTGAANDRDSILVRVGSVPTATYTGYTLEDVNMDGKVKYTGSNNDRDPVVTNLGGLPTSVVNSSVP